MKRSLLIAVLAITSLLLAGCKERQRASLPSLDVVKLSEREAYRYNKVLVEVKECEALMSAIDKNATNAQIAQLITKVRALRYSYSSEGMNHATIEHCKALCQRIKSMQDKVGPLIEEKYRSKRGLELFSFSDTLLTETCTTPLYLNAGEMVYFKMSASEKVGFSLNSYDLHRPLKYFETNSLCDSLKIDHSGIYTFDIIPALKSRCYSSLRVSVHTNNVDNVFRQKVISETVACNKEDYGAKAVKTIKMINIFESPRQFTLRGHLKATFSGNAKAVVSVPIPTGATDILYSLRVATSEQGHSSDGEFHNNLTNSYKKVKLLGLPIYEKEKRHGLLVRLLDDNRPIHQEDAYCNMYLFRESSQAKQFQDGTKAVSSLEYDVDYSTIGTQSCNGRIPTDGAKTLYLGFENERMRYVSYLWIEVVAIVPTTEYYTTKYSVQ